MIINRRVVMIGVKNQYLRYYWQRCVLRGKLTLTNKGT